ncbi:hypothetical protein CY34DRAFT_810215 [Suillus luteus UH-Slu-Lm8-n1]|uniref:Unplaced genomic scaffold CY34scaffold_312, whole genome shotgun sequence n=1 Tax=Suillus luteus UH-Slu-Lm8-n1 TaxID=930992 RepID=A0A0D0B0H5_9AGAM|nr:hypothetical protein CY34DRAFT_810215 [Suillus luteus UH-Slu-Lm8-n1]
MPPIPKRRKLSDITVGDTNELLYKLEEFRSSLDEGDENLPSGLFSKLQELRDKLEDHASFSKVDPMTLLSLKISSGPLFLINDKRQEVESLGLAETPGCLPIDTTRFLISLVRGHVASVTEAGSRILINMLLLRVVSVMCLGDTAVNIIPEFPLPRTIFNQDSGKCSFSGVVDFLVTKLPARYTEYLLGDPTTALANPSYIQGPTTSNIFEAKHDNVRAALPQAAIAASSYCQLQGLFVVRGVVTSGEQWIFFMYERHTDGTGLVRSSPQYTLGRNLEGLALVLGLLRDSIDNATSSDHTFFTTT